MEQIENVLIAGASGEIGRAVALRLACSSRRIALVHGPNTQVDEVWYQSIAAKAAETCIVGGNLADDQGVLDVLQVLEERTSSWGTYGRVITCIGATGKRRAISEWSGSYLNEILRNNFIAPALFIGKSLSLVSQPGGCIVILGSIAGNTGSGSGSAAYSCAKAALHNLVYSLAKEAKDKGIRVVGLAPGLIDTDFHGEYRERARDNAKKATMAKRIGSAEEIAAIVDFLSSKHCEYIWGTIVTADGGILL